MNNASQKRHEALYRRTIDSFCSSVRAGEFSADKVSGHIFDLRQELGQCIELMLISPEFYQKQQDKLYRAEETIEDLKDGTKDRVVHLDLAAA